MLKPISRGETCNQTSAYSGSTALIQFWLSLSVPLVGFCPNNLPLEQIMPKLSIIVDLYCLISSSLICPLSCNSKVKASVSSSSLLSERSRRSCKSSRLRPRACSLDIFFTSPPDLSKVNTQVCLSVSHFCIFEPGGFLGRCLFAEVFGEAGLFITG